MPRRAAARRAAPLRRELGEGGGGEGGGGAERSPSYTNAVLDAASKTHDAGSEDTSNGAGLYVQ